MKFELGNLVKTNRVLFQGRKKIDYDPRLIAQSPKKNILDPDNITRDDLLASDFVCSGEELFVFSRVGVKTFMFTDNLSKKDNLSEVSYELELTVDTDFSSYIDFILSKLQDSIYFLENYFNGIVAGKSFDNSINQFKKSFVDDIMNQLGISYDDSRNIDMSNNIISQSQFGQAAKNYYNVLLLLRPNIDKNIYSQIIKRLLPVKNSNPSVISSVIAQFSTVYNEVIKVYGRKNDKLINNRKRSIVGAKQKLNSKIIKKTKERYKIEQDKLGYNIFDVNQKGINLFTRKQYADRFLSERDRYYTSLVNSPELNVLKPTERADFLNASSGAKFLTPVSFVMGEERLDVTRGLKSLNPESFKQFKSLKAIKSKRRQVESFNGTTELNKIASNSTTLFNIAVSKPSMSLLDQKNEVVNDSHIDVKEYLGSQSFFISENPVIIRANLKNILLKKDNKTTLSLVGDFIPRKILKPKQAIKSIREINISNPKSRFTGGVVNNSLTIKNIPPQIRVMALDSFATIHNLSDPIKNPNSNAVLSETQQNVFLVSALVGFKRFPEGFIDVNQPIYTDLDLLFNNIPANGLLAKAYDYEIPEIGIVKDKFSSTIYNNLIYIRG